VSKQDEGCREQILFNSVSLLTSFLNMPVV